MRVAFVADVHVDNFKPFGGPFKSGINRRGRIVLDTLHQAAATATGKDCTDLVVLGDLFDSSSPTPQLVAATARAFGPVKTTHLLLGNHDQVSTDFRDNAFAPFEYMPHFHVHEKVFQWGMMTMAPFQPGPAKKWLPKILKNIDGKGGALCIHLGVQDEETPKFLQNAHDSITVEQLVKIAKERNFSTVFAGNWHDHKTWDIDGVRVFQLGTLAPKTFSDEGLEDRGYMAVWDSGAGDVDLIEIKGPRFVKCAELDDFIELVEHERDWDPIIRNQIFVRVNVLPSELEELRAIELPDHIQVTAEIDDADAKRKAQAAAQTAASSESFDEALDEFINRFPIDEPATREGVVRLVSKYRRKAGG